MAGAGDRNGGLKLSKRWVLDGFRHRFLTFPSQRFFMFIYLSIY